MSDGGSTQHDCNMEGKGRVTITSPWPYQPGFFRVYVPNMRTLLLSFSYALLLEVFDLCETH